MSVRIRQYTAETLPAVEDRPSIIAEQGEIAGLTRNVAEQATDVSAKWADITGNIEAQADHLENLQKKADRDGAKKQIHLDLSNDPAIMQNPSLYEKEFVTRMDKVDVAIRDTTRSPRSRTAYEIYAQREAPGDFAEARALGSKLHEQKLQGDFVVESNRLAKKAGESGSVAEYDQTIREAERLFQGTEARRFMTPGQIEIARERFMKEVADNHMRSVGAKNPTLMRQLDKEGVWTPALSVHERATILEHVASQERIANEVNNARTAQAQRAYHFEMIGLANKGLVSQSAIELGRAGMDPVLPDPRVWNQIRDINEKSGVPTSNGETAAKSILLKFRLNPNPTKQDATAALGELSSVHNEGGHNQKSLDAISSAAKEIQSAFAAEERDLRGAERMGQAVADRIERDRRQKEIDERRHIQDTLTKAHARFNVKVPPKAQPSEFMDKQYKNKRLLIWNELKKRIIEDPHGIDVDKALEEIVGVAGAKRTPDNIDQYFTQPRNQRGQ